MSVSKDLSHHRRNYVKHELVEGHIANNPFDQFAQWFEDAGKAEVLEPNAMTLATATKTGKPSARVVLLKSFGPEGLVFYTNYHSRKGHEMSENNQAAILFYWDVMERQVRIEGYIEKVRPDESDIYFHSRPAASRIGAWASPQSRKIADRNILDLNYSKYEEEFSNIDIPRPPHWGGYRVMPSHIEFWQGRISRMHDRIVFTRNEAGNWDRNRLAP